jgi:bifunctional DNA-binding transcriptional regulator/antitoxin component of YhaV-PrlF toxin-antitoxin module
MWFGMLHTTITGGGHIQIPLELLEELKLFDGDLLDSVVTRFSTKGPSIVSERQPGKKTHSLHSELPRLSIA